MYVISRQKICPRCRFEMDIASAMAAALGVPDLDPFSAKNPNCNKCVVMHVQVDRATNYEEAVGILREICGTPTTKQP